MTPLYSIGTWDGDLNAYTPQIGLTVPSFNITRSQLRQAIRDLRGMGYSVHRIRDADGEHWDNDTSVIIERTDGELPEFILKYWVR